MKVLKPLEVAAVGKVETYKHLQEQNQELKNATNTVFMAHMEVE